MKQGILSLIMTALLGSSGVARADNATYLLVHGALSLPSPETNNESIGVVRDYFAALRSGNVAALGQIFADDIVWHQPGSGSLSGTYRGKTAVFELFGKFMQISAGSFRIDSVETLMANGNLVAAPLHFSAAHTGGAISMAGVDIIRVEQGKIVEMFLFSSDQEAEDRFWSYQAPAMP